MVGRNQRVSQAHVDPLAPHRRHGVRGVAQEQKSRGRPRLNTIRRGIEQKRMSDAAGMALEVSTEFGGNVVRHRVDPLFHTAIAQAAVGALQDDPADLDIPVVGDVGHQQVSAARVGPHPTAVEGRVIAVGQGRELAPNDVEENAITMDAETRRG